MRERERRRGEKVEEPAPSVNVVKSYPHFPTKSVAGMRPTASRTIVYPMPRRVLHARLSLLLP